MLTHHIKWIILLSLLFILVMTGALVTNSKTVPLSDKITVSFIEQTDNNQQVSEIISIPNQQWIDPKNSSRTSGNNRTYWLKIALNLGNTDVNSPQWLLTINTLLIDQLVVYTRDLTFPDHLNFISTKAPLHLVSNSHTFGLALNNNEDKSKVYIKYTGQPPSLVYVSLVNQNDYLTMHDSQILLVGIVIGLLLLAISQAIISYWSFKITQYFYYSGYLITTTMLWLSFNGFTDYLLWPQLEFVRHAGLSIMILLDLFFAVKITIGAPGFVLKKQPHPLLNKLFIVSLLSLGLLTLFIPQYIAGCLILVAVLICSLALTALSYKLVYEQAKSAAFHLFAWLSLLGGALLVALKYSALVDIEHSFLWLISVAVFSQLLTYYVMLTKQIFNQRATILVQKKTAQQQLQQFKEQREVELRQEEKHQLDLEALVDERNFELNITLHELQDTNRRLEEQSTIDALTGVKNRKFFDSQYQAEQRLSRRQQTPLALLIVDADNFKAVNDNYGHLAGDKVLIEICRRAASVLKRPNDYVCRYGGEEFAILLPNTDSIGALKIAEQIRLKIAQTPIDAESYQLTVTVSIGLSCTIVESGLDPNAMFIAADKALYQAKETGRNKVVLAPQC